MERRESIYHRQGLGKTATEFTPEETREDKVVLDVHSILNWVNKDDPTGPFPSTPSADAQFNNWEVGVRNWAEAQGYRDETDEIIPKEQDDLHTPDYQPKGEFILNPDGSFIAPESRVSVSLKIESRFPVEQVDLFWGNQFLGSSKTPPYQFSFTASGAPGESITLKARIYDQMKNTAVVSRAVTLQE